MGCHPVGGGEWLAIFWVISHLCTFLTFYFYFHVWARCPSNGAVLSFSRLGHNDCVLIIAVHWVPCRCCVHTVPFSPLDGLIGSERWRDWPVITQQQSQEPYLGPYDCKSHSHGPSVRVPHVTCVLGEQLRPWQLVLVVSADFSLLLW